MSTPHKETPARLPDDGSEGGGRERLITRKILRLDTPDGRKTAEQLARYGVPYVIPGS
jgi:hypothetical protein